MVAARRIIDIPADRLAFCPVRNIPDRTGDKWSLLPILHLGCIDNLLFNELRKRITGIVWRMLTVMLRALGADSLMVCTVYG